MKKQTGFICLACAILLMGCQANRPRETTPASLEPTRITSLPPTVTTAPPSATSTGTAEPTQSGTPTPSPTPPVPPEARLKFQCLEILPNLPMDSKLTGIVVLKSHVSIGGGYESSDAFLLNLAMGEANQIVAEHERQWGYSVSPNKELLAYRSVLRNTAGEIIQEELVIANADGERLKSIPGMEDLVDILGWLDNERLVVKIAGLERKDSDIELAATFVVLNPFNGEQQILRPNFPRIYDLTPIPYMEGWSVTRYDRTLSRVVYVRVTNGNPEFVLWDLQKHEPLAVWEFILAIPRWSPDSSRLVVDSPIKDTSDLELFLVSRDGQIEQLTNLNAYSPTIFFNYSWSTDGRKIAAWVFHGDALNLSYNREAELVMIDTSTRQVTDTCIRVKYRGEGYGGGAPPILPPIWSPDGTQLIVQDWYEADHRRVYLVDPGRGFAAPIAEDMEPVGWMLAP